MSQPYGLDLDVVVPPGIAFEEQALRRRARVALQRDDGRRVFHGLITEIEALGPDARHHMPMLAYAVRIVPAMWLMTLRRTSRIFQNLNVCGVIHEVLGEYEIPHRFTLVRSYPSRPFCTQYEETDLAFLQRLTAEAGIFFFFEQPRLQDIEFDEAPGALDVATAMSRSMPLAARALGDALDASARPRELVVFGDSHLAYLPTGSGDGPSWEQLATGATTAARRVADALCSPGLIDAGRVGDAFSLAGGPAVAERTPVLTVRDDTGAMVAGSELTVSRWRRRRTVATDRFTFRYFDPDRPAEPLTASIRVTDHAPDDILLGAVQFGASAAADMVGRGLTEAARPLVAASADLAQHALRHDELEQYEHHSDFLFPRWDDGREEPKRMAMAARRRVDVSHAASTNPWLEPGRTFELEGHDIEANNRRYAVIAMDHRFTAGFELGDSYENTMECVPHDVAYLQERPSRRNVQVCLTATVLGGDGGDIHTDRGGHARVRFHWDRGQAALYNTCFIRVMQPWAGPGFGTLFLPRQGSEVVVTFEGGDPDRPLIIGCVFNAANQPPVPLPEQRTKSGLRTSSTPGGDGANELWFDDAAGREQVFLGAERDFDQEVGRHRCATVHGDERLTVEGDMHQTVRGRTHGQVVGDVETRIHGNESHSVEGARNLNVRGSEAHHVTRDSELNIGGGRTLHVRGAHGLHVGGDTVSRHAGNVTTIVGTADRARSATTRVEGRCTVSSSERLELSSDSNITLRCGDSSLTLTPTGMELRSPSVLLAGDGARIRLRDQVVKVLGETRIQGKAPQIVWKSEAASLSLSSEAAVEGTTILLNSPASATDPVADDPVVLTRIFLEDQDGRPIPRQAYRIALPGGAELTGMLDDSGRAELEIDADATISFPGVREVERT